MSKIKSRRIGSILMLVALISVGFNQAAQATSAKSVTTTNVTQAVAQSYNADSSVDLGMIVELKPGVPNTVQALPQSDIKNMLGVAVQQNQATIALTPQNVSHQQIFVATTGRYEALVSNQNGSIATGDLITISSLAGVGMKADSSESEVLGKAAASFNGTGNVVGTANITNSLGKTTQISIGTMPVNLDISHNPLQSYTTNNVPGPLSKAASSIANKPVSAARIYLGLVLIIAAALLTGIVLFSGIRGAMISIGRNPLSKKPIIGGLIQTLIVGLGVFVVGVFGVYLLLKL